MHEHAATATTAQLHAIENIDSKQIQTRLNRAANRLRKSEPRGELVGLFAANDVCSLIPAVEQFGELEHIVAQQVRALAFQRIVNSLPEPGDV